MSFITLITFLSLNSCYYLRMILIISFLIFKLFSLFLRKFILPISGIWFPSNYFTSTTIILKTSLKIIHTEAQRVHTDGNFLRAACPLPIHYRPRVHPKAHEFYKQHPACIARIRPAVTGCAWKDVRQVVRNCSCVTDGDNREVFQGYS